ncbi:MAG: hypothetical protein NTY93_01505 [Candidatus Kaiserbacteria bacterium]|nr:hypothetical protein [Candidatus Kaiserbacteria bacterium]
MLENIKVLLNYIRKQKERELRWFQTRQRRGWCAHGRVGQAHFVGAFAFPSKKSSLQKIFGLNLSLHAREARGNAYFPYVALRAAKFSASEMPLGLILESLLKHARTYFTQNPTN